MCANNLKLWIYLQVEKLLYTEPCKKIENWKILYAHLWTLSCNTQLPAAHW